MDYIFLLVEMLQVSLIFVSFSLTLFMFPKPVFIKINHSIYAGRTAGVDTLRHKPYIGHGSTWVVIGD